jgi:alpha-L-arabinofuranosidase
MTRVPFAWFSAGFGLLFLGPAVCSAQDARIVIRPDQPGITVSPSLYGIFFEEINFAGDGGLHAELLRNRGFQEGAAGAIPPYWKEKAGKAILDGSTGFAGRPSLALAPKTTVVNEGFWGVPLKRDATYRLTVWAKGVGKLSAGLGAQDREPEMVTVGRPGDYWQRFVVRIKATADTSLGSLRLESDGQAWIGFASLMPEGAWGTKKLLRTDLAERVRQVSPSFVRFPGGCYVEGHNLAQRFDWKASLGPIESRPGSAQRLWGYSSTDGLGYHEYLQWCEDLGSDAMFVANCGMSHSEIEPLATMDKWVQDALDAVEYARGPVNSKWGALRAKNGHPKPFRLKFLEIGNENGQSWSFGGVAPYVDRYKLIYDALKAKYPDLVLISNAVVPHEMQMVDEHYYSNPAFFWQNIGRYDKYDRTGPAIYVGEYAVTQDCGEGNLKAALAEAAFMTGMERNSDVVKLASYAPLFVNKNARQWNPNAIVFDNERSFGTPSYHVQAIFAKNRPDRIVPLTLTVPTPAHRIEGGIGVMTWKTQSEFKDLKVEVDGKDLYNSAESIGTWKSVTGEWAIGETIIGKSLREDCRTTLDDLKLDGAKKAVVTLKARKIAGEEGFIVMFQTIAGSRIQWNLGGWGNTAHGFEQGGRMNSGVPGAIETDRWYDIRIEMEGPKIRGFLDGKLIEEVEVKPTPNFTAVSGVSGRDLIIKVVNGSDKVMSTLVDLGSKAAIRGAQTVLTGPDLNAENSFSSPDLISPKKQNFTASASPFIVRFEPRSLTILRIPWDGLGRK